RIGRRARRWSLRAGSGQRATPIDDLAVQRSGRRAQVEREGGGEGGGGGARQVGKQRGAGAERLDGRDARAGAAAGDDGGEQLEWGGDVQGEAVNGHAAMHVH